jgi:hypothetical protein
MVRVLVVLCLAPSLGACYNYESLHRSDLAPSTYLAVTLTDSGATELMRYLGPEVKTVRGRLLSAGQDGFRLSVDEVESRRGDVLHWRGESVSLPGDFVGRIDVRHVSHGKTVLLLATSMLGFALASRAFGPGSFGGGSSGGPPPVSR